METGKEDDNKLGALFSTESSDCNCLYAAKPTGGSGEPKTELEADSSCEPSSYYLVILFSFLWVSDCWSDKTRHHLGHIVINQRNNRQINL